MYKIIKKAFAVAAALTLTACTDGTTTVIQQEIDDSIDSLEISELVYDKLDIVNDFLEAEGQYTAAVLINGEEGYIGLANKSGLNLGAFLIGDENDESELEVVIAGDGITLKNDGEEKFRYEFCVFGKNDDFDRITVASVEEALAANGCIVETDDEQIVTLDNISLSNSLTDTANILSSVYPTIYEITKEDSDIAEAMNEALDGEWDISEGISSDMLDAYLTFMLDKADGFLLNKDNAFCAEILFIKGGIKITVATEKNDIQFGLTSDGKIDNSGTDKTGSVE